jgi:hypothetical protein
VRVGSRVISIHLESQKKNKNWEKIVEFKDPKKKKNGDLWEGSIDQFLIEFKD